MRGFLWSVGTRRSSLADSRLRFDRTEWPRLQQNQRGLGQAGSQL